MIMLFEFVITIFVKVFIITYKWLHDNLIAYLLNLAKGFELVIIVIAVISFLLFNLFLTMVHLRKLPKYYAIQIVDAYGNKTAVKGLRVIFTTYDVAESYARFYQDIYKDQYKFRVTGLKE
jgi:CBS domain containing-hemolysin-like protein